MTDFSISGYKIETQNACNILNEAGITSTDILKQIDTNTDNTISEDELVEFIDEENEEETTNSSNSNAESVNEQIAAYDELNASLETQLNQLYNQLGSAKDLDETDSILSSIDSIEEQIESNREAIYNLLVDKENQQLAAASGTTTSTSRLTTGSGISGTTEFGSSIVSTAQSYVGQLKESDGSYLEVTGGRSEAWCADFVTYVVKQAAQETGTSLNGFGSASVSGLMAWGQANNCYTSINDMSDSQKAQWVVENVQPGDVMIMKNGASHTGIVTCVYSDGSFDTVEGNTSDQCLERHYSASEAKLSGFIDIT